MNTAQRATEERQMRSLAATHALIAERDLGRFATFLEVAEGEMFPNGMESMSGYVVVEDGREFFFWLDWDSEHGRPRLGTWKEVTEPSAETPRGEYAEALAAVGRLESARDRERAAG
jgi:hypothetical protein